MRKETSTLEMFTKLKQKSFLYGATIKANVEMIYRPTAGGTISSLAALSKSIFWYCQINEAPSSGIWTYQHYEKELTGNEWYFDTSYATGSTNSHYWSKKCGWKHTYEGLKRRGLRIWYNISQVSEAKTWLTLVNVLLMYSAASLPISIAASTFVTPNKTITESVSPYITWYYQLVSSQENPLQKGLSLKELITKYIYKLKRLTGV